MQTCVGQAAQACSEQMVNIMFVIYVGVNLHTNKLALHNVIYFISPYINQIKQVLMTKQFKTERKWYKLLIADNNIFRLIGICGSVGSGKTSFISTIIGQLNIEEGSLALDGSIAYVPQQAWIFHDSAQENILFGLPYDETKYNSGKINYFNILLVTS